MKRSLFSISIAALAAVSSIPASAAQEDLIYVAVDPCRLVDTRNAGGALAANTFRDFVASGNVTAQGGAAGGCADPKAGAVQPLAISAYVLAVPDTGSAAGVLTAYPSDQPPPPVGAGSTVNFAPGQVIGNTTNIPLCDPAGCTAAEFAVLARSTNQHVVVDVQGYYYPATGGAGNCPTDMVAVGSLCVDKYEASVTDKAGGTQYGLTSADYPCSGSGRDCGADQAGTNPAIYARSLANQIPSGYLSQWQAAQACANVGKRLPTSAEWQTAASGTPSGATCNANPGGTASATGSIPTCVSTTGAFDMIGNRWEWIADMDNPSTSGTTSTNSSKAYLMGDGFAGTGDATTRALWVVTPSGNSGGPSSRLGLRCVR